MDEVISFINANINDISHFEGGGYHVLIHMKNGDTIEFYGNDGILAHHYKD